VRKRSLIEKLDEILGEKNVQHPIDRDAHFLFKARQFAPVNSPPEKPGEESGKVYAKNLFEAVAAYLYCCSAVCRSKRRIVRASRCYNIGAHAV
jgi:hypothetical protein